MSVNNITINLILCIYYINKHNTSLFISLSVPSPAQNVSVSSNNTHLIVTWEPPSEPNGIVTYTVQLLETDLLQSTTVNITSQEVSELSLIIEFMTKPYRQYTATVTAQTVAGMGESEEGGLMTPEGGIERCANLC